MFLGPEAIFVTQDPSGITFHATRAPCVVADGVQMHYCGCDIQIQSVVAVSDDGEVPVISDSSGWASLYRPLLPSVVDPNEAPTEVAPSIPVAEEGETPSIPETPQLEPDQGALPPVDEAAGVATRIEGKEATTQTPPLLSRLIQGYLDHTGIEECP